MVLIPISDDQPLIAYRIADELGLAVRLELETFNEEDVHNAMHKIFDDKQYYVRVDRLSKISHEYPSWLQKRSQI